MDARGGMKVREMLAASFSKRSTDKNYNRAHG
jgi:hypothetical protein